MGQIETTTETAIDQVANILPSIPQIDNRPPLESLISVHDFETVARDTFTKKTFAFYSSAATDLVTQRENIKVWRKLMLRPRILRNVKDVCIKRRILGCDSDAPFFVSPAAMAKLAHPEGELAIARGCATENIIQTVSPMQAFTSYDTSNTS